jgi:anti-sigma B factor antagonist
MAAGALLVSVRGPGELVLVGELDAATAPGLAEAIARHRVVGAALILDLSGLAFIDSSGIRCLIQAWRSSAQRFVLRNPTEPVRRVLDVALPDAKARDVWEVA